MNFTRRAVPVDVVFAACFSLGFVLRHHLFPPCLNQEDIDRIRREKSDDHADLHHEARSETLKRGLSVPFWQTQLSLGLLKRSEMRAR